MNWLKKYRELIVYIIVGVLTTIVSLGVYYACVFTVLDPTDAIQLQVANVISWVCAVIFAYVTNRKFVFQSTSTDIAKEFTSFVGSRVATLLMDCAIMFISVTLLGFNDKIAKLIVQVVVTVGNYVLAKLWVFKDKNKSENLKDCQN